METEPQQLHVVLFPFMAHGHMIPTLDVARLFADRPGVKATIVTTPLNVLTFVKAINKKKDEMINIEILRFPAQESGLPEGCENTEQAFMLGLIDKFFRASEMLQEPLEEYLEKTRPNCLVADMFFPWATESAAKFNVPRLVFHGMCSFSLCAQEVVRLYKPYKNVMSDEDEFTLPLIPHEVKMTRLQLPFYQRKDDEETDFGRRFKEVKESEVESYGVIVNSFYELEPDYADFYRKEQGRRAWYIGPVSLCNRSVEDKVHRGKESSIDEQDCLKWLNTKKSNSVIYICFGSTTSPIAPQLYEIAMAIEDSEQEFIWVMRNHGDGNDGELFPSGFEQRVKGKGLIIRGWAPQVLILEHEAIGAFVTHCGWNSTLEGISAGVPMVTWPSFAEQFYNEKLITQILKIGIPIGAKKWDRVPSKDDIVKRNAIEKALREIMVGDEAAERRSRAKKLKEMAWKAVEEGGSSYSDLSELINELRSYQA